MKKNNVLMLIFSCFLINGNFTSAQTTITLNPGPTDGKDAFIRDIAPTTNFGYNAEFGASAWTYSGSNMIVKSFIDFDFSSIPAGATITSANLYLYNYPDAQTNNGEHSQLSGTNELILQRVTTDWDEMTITWANQPTTTTQNQIIIPPSTSIHQDYLIDVTTLTQDIINNPTTSNGFMFKLQTEIKYRCVVFAASNVTDASLRPKLIITYVNNNTNCLTIRPSAAEGKDAFIRDIAPTTNFGYNAEFGASAWTFSGSPMIVKSLIDFDFSAIPAGATINSASLYLYNYPDAQTNNGEHSQLNGSNELILQRITSDWGDLTVTWANQPTTTTQNQMIIPASTSIHQDYSIDVTTLTQDIINNPATSNGFMFKLQTEEQYRCVIFATSNVIDTNLAPKIVICYTDNSSVNTHDFSDSFHFYPNPATETVTVDNLSLSDETTISIIDFYGRIVSKEICNSNSIEIDIRDLPKGIYLLRKQTRLSDNIAKLVIQ